jgi:hypothetical protein
MGCRQALPPKQPLPTITHDLLLSVASTSVDEAQPLAVQYNATMILFDYFTAYGKVTGT